MLPLSLILVANPCDYLIYMIRTNFGLNNNSRPLPNRGLLPDQFPTKAKSRTAACLVSNSGPCNLPTCTSSCFHYLCKVRCQLSSIRTTNETKRPFTTGNFPLPPQFGTDMPTSRTLYNRSIKVLEPSTTHARTHR